MTPKALPRDPWPIINRTRQAIIDGTATADEVTAAQRAAILASPATMASVLDPLYEMPPHVRLLDQHLVAVERGVIDRLLVLMPPRHSKSWNTSRFNPVWNLRKDPSRLMMLLGYGDEFVADFGGAARDLVRDNPVIDLTIKGDTKAKNRWNVVGQRGGLVTSGLLGQITGKGANCLTIDDPVKNWEDANSAPMREKMWDTYTSTARTRLQGRGSSIVVAMTPWHDEDIAGRLQANQRGLWCVLKLTAIAEKDETLSDVTDASADDLRRWEGDDVPWDRKAGEALWPARYDREWLEQTHVEVGPYVWQALYQCSPTPASGGLFRRNEFRYYRRIQATEGQLIELNSDGIITHVRPRDCWTFATCDLAASTRTSADWTVYAVWTVTPQGDLLLTDRYRGRIGEDRHWAELAALHARHKLSFAAIERGFIGTTLTYEAGKRGLPVRSFDPRGADKFTRALPAAARYSSGRIFHPDPATHPWVTSEWEPEHLAFPHGSHDDMVDCTAMACSFVTGSKGARSRTDGGYAKDDYSQEARFARLNAEMNKPRRRGRAVHGELGRL